MSTRSYAGQGNWSRSAISGRGWVATSLPASSRNEMPWISPPAGTVMQALQQLDKRLLALAANDHVDHAARQDLLRGIREVRPAGHDAAFRMPPFDPFGRAQGPWCRDGLFAHAQHVDAPLVDLPFQRPPAPLIARGVPDLDLRLRQCSARPRPDTAGPAAARMRKSRC